ncbi:MBL fold metallo-hydrolase [Devosia sp. PTR5]|uniref:MBL fold metallo-hydrolase n=1 Tax=Devosia oryzisoli TaxID=2774138 RepID=A0A927FW87_9HYPH|nr:MBL fold metallo-hydrolase [Devosia oryzisoli]MBD8066667.1 MBL fold metallo-hydrolase [Devosia oryzisoli]
MVTRRTTLAGLAALPLAGSLTTAFGTLPALAQEKPMADTLATSEGDVTIQPVSHASLVLSWGDKAMYVDPVGGEGLYEGLPAPTSILITHGHGDHFDAPTLEAIAGSAPILTTKEVFDKLPESLKGQAKAISNGESGELDGVPVKAIAAHNTTADRMQYHPVGVGNGYVLSLGDKQVYVAGDTEPTEDMLALTDIAVAFLPMNLPYTMTADQAVEAINTFKPAVVYPYHFRDMDLSPLETGLDEGIELRLRDWYAAGGQG